MNACEKSFFLKSPNGQLSAVLHEAESEKIVILSHGFTGSKQESGRLFVTAARSLAAAGFNALRFDFMGSGDSSGDFNEMSPNTEIADLLAVINWAKRRKYSRIGLLGLSFGGAVSIFSADQSCDVDVLVTWSAVPSLKFWIQKPTKKITNIPTEPGRKFYTDWPVIDVPEAYCGLTIPKLQIQGDHDIEGFREEFTRFFPKAQPLKKHQVIPGGDHVFTQWRHRRKVISETVKWFKKYL